MVGALRPAAYLSESSRLLRQIGRGDVACIRTLLRLHPLV